MNVLERLAGLVERLYGETADYIDNPSDAQMWYNRGYANGVVAYYRQHDYMQYLNQLSVDAEDVHQSERIMEWQKAYHHGFEMGERETAEVVLGVK